MKISFIFILTFFYLLLSSVRRNRVGFTATYVLEQTCEYLTPIPAITHFDAFGLSSQPRTFTHLPFPRSHAF